MRIHLGADHGGYELKEYLKAELEKLGHEVLDCGTFALDPTDDYPQFAFAVGEAVQHDSSQGVASFGILACRSGGGMTIAANKVPGVRAVSIHTIESAQHARQHNDARVATISGDWVSQTEALALVDAFISTPFSGDERHVRRISQIATYELTAGKHD